MMKFRTTHFLHMLASVGGWLRALASPGVMVVVAILGSAGAQAKQCIWNNGAFPMGVSWFRPIDIGAPEKTRPGGWHMTLRNIAPPVLTQRIDAGMASCNPSEQELVAFISVLGCLAYKYEANQPAYACDTGKVHVHPGVKTSHLRHIAGKVQPILCNPDPTGYCTANEMAMTPSLPDKPVLVIVPSSSHYLEFWGTVSEVQWGQGGTLR